ncbi:MAG: hypothetical protein P1U34_06430 [Coxiellaceae bacterium]|nr:hypothetical protein [Coxiellaceae bacterium]
MLKGMKKAVSSRFNVKRWIGYDQLKDSAKFIGETYSDLSPKKEKERRKRQNKNLSFEEMMQMNRMTDEDIEKGQATQRNACILFAAFAVLPVGYAIYLFMVGLILGGIVSFLGGMLCLAYAFRYRVGVYQYKHRVVNVDPKVVLKELFRF